MTARYFCKKCGKDVSVKDKKCPYCGYEGIDGKPFKYYFGEGWKMKLIRCEKCRAPLALTEFVKANADINKLKKKE